MTKLLIDECLSAELALMARERGHHEASHVVWIGKSGWRDWEWKQALLDDDWVLVTWNCKDFRGPKDAPGSRGVFANVPLHAGLICIDGPTGMDLDLQRSLFAFVLEEAGRGAKPHQSSPRSLRRRIMRARRHHPICLTRAEIAINPVGERFSLFSSLEERLSGGLLPTSRPTVIGWTCLDEQGHANGYA